VHKHQTPTSVNEITVSFRFEEDSRLSREIFPQFNLIALSIISKRKNSYHQQSQSRITPMFIEISCYRAGNKYKAINPLSN
jgi:hypothetical protein